MNGIPLKFNLLKIWEFLCSLKQHNGEIKGGAKASRAGRPWICACIIQGFKDRNEGICLIETIEYRKDLCSLFRIERSSQVIKWMTFLNPMSWKELCTCYVSRSYFRVLLYKMIMEFYFSVSLLSKCVVVYAKLISAVSISWY